MKNLLGMSLSALGCCLIANTAEGQIIPDGSLPTNVERQGRITEITGGERAGNNLFHSFQDFSVPTGNEAFFNNGLDISNILSRVTGGNISNIDGLIRANGTANLFLVNPAGIMFGDNATLEIGGSFFGSTATGIEFADGTEFVSTNTDNPILTINAPVGLNLRDTTGEISSTASLSSDRSLTLSANTLALTGQLQAEDNIILEASEQIAIQDSAIRPFIASAGDRLLLQGDRQIAISALNNPNSGLFSSGDLILRSNNPINGDAHYYSGSNLRLERLDGSLGKLVSVEDPVLRSRGDVSFAGYQGASLHILAGGNVTIEGDVNITGADTTADFLQETITLTNGAQLNIDGSTEPTLDIRAGTNSFGTPETETTASTPTGSEINIQGSVINPGGRVLLTNQYRPNNNLTAGKIAVSAINTSNPAGNGGDVAIDSRNNINVPNGIDTSSLINTQLTTIANLQTFPQITIASGDAGAIALLAEQNIAAGDFNAMAAVNLELNTAVDTIAEANNIFAIPQANIRAGAGGNITLRAGNNIDVGNIDSGSAIVINSNSVSEDSFSIVTALLELNTDNGGQIDIEAEDSLNTENISSSVAVSDRLTSNAETTPNITLSVSQIGLTISQANIGSGGEIFLEAGDNINTASLDSSVTITNIANNTATILANNPQTATAQRPSRVVSQIAVTYDNTNIGSGGEITLTGDRAEVGGVNSSLSITSENTVLAEATADNDTFANSLARSDISLDVVGNRPGEITFDVIGGVNFNLLDAAAIANDGTNNLDSRAFSNSTNAIANADGNGTNTITFDSQANSAPINFNLNLPEVDYAIAPVNSLPSNTIQPVAFDLCPTNADAIEQNQAITTAKGKIYPARGITVENGQIRLTARPAIGNSQRSSIRFGDCN